MPLTTSRKFILQTNKNHLVANILLFTQFPTFLVTKKKRKSSNPNRRAYSHIMFHSQRKVSESSSSSSAVAIFYIIKNFTNLFVIKTITKFRSYNAHNNFFRRVRKQQELYISDERTKRTKIACKCSFYCNLNSVLG